MANPVTSRSIATVARVTPTSTLPGFPASALLDWTHPYRVWKAGAVISASDAVVFDFGVATTIPYVVIDHTNSADISIQGHATDSWGAPAYNSGEVPVLDRIDGRYKLFSLTAAFNYRYLRIKNNATVTTDGQRFWQLGTVVALTAIDTWVSPIGYPYETEHRQAVIRSALDVAETGNRYAQIRLSQALIQAGSETSFLDVIGYGEATPFWFFRNAGNDAEVYPVRRLGPAPIAQAGPNHWTLPSLVLEECR